MREVSTSAHVSTCVSTSTVVISHLLLSHGGQAWTCPYILLSLKASALLRQYTRSSPSTGYEPGPALYPKPLQK